METAEFNDQAHNMHSAGNDAADSLVSFEESLNRLVERLELTGQQIQKIMAIKDRAEVVVDRVVGFSQSAVQEVKKSPKSFMALGLVVGWLIWNHTNQRMQSQRTQLPASDLHH